MPWRARLGFGQILKFVDTQGSRNAVMAIPVLGDHASRSLAAFRLMMAALYGVWFHFKFGPTFEVTPFIAFYWSYFAISAALFVISLKSWWWDFQLSFMSFLVDIIAFAASLIVVSTIIAEFISPIFAFFTFLLISAFVRWSQKVLPAVAAFLGILSLSAGLAIHWLGEPIDLVQTIRRFTYLVLIALILTRFCINRGAYAVCRFNPPSGDADLEPYDALLDYAMRASRARSIALVWSPTDEPWTSAELAGGLGRRCQRLSAEAEQAVGQAVMFDAPGHRALMLDEQGRLKSSRPPQPPFLAAELGLAEGIVCPLAGASGSGELLLSDISGMSWEDLFVAENIAREVAIGLEEQSAIASAREVAAFRLKRDLARDLHDSVAQSLAGTRFRLESLRQSAGNGKACLPQIDSICEALTREQAQVREVIDQLRQDRPRTGTRDLASELSALAQLLAERWDISLQVDGDGSPLRIDTPTLFEIQQLVREGVSNAVRHGSATRVLLTVTTDKDGQLDLTLEDDGIGFDATIGPLRPRSISERVALLGGTLAVDSFNGKTQLRIRIPLKAGRCAL